MEVSEFFRRLVCALLICLLLIPGAFADVPDISNLTDAEIVELHGKVTEELVGQGIEKSAELPAGKYTGGKN